MNPEEFIHEHVASVGRPFLRSVRQLIHIDQHGEPGPVGSCVLLQHDGKKYLISAAHVLDVFKNEPLFIGTATKWHQLVGDFTTTSIEPGKSRDDDPYDYAIFPISEDDAAQIDGCHFLTTDQVALGERAVFNPPYRSKYLALGWPRNRLNFRRKAHLTEPTNVAFTGVIAPEELYKKYNRSPNRHILIEYERKELFSEAGGHLPPSFDGMSGGGIFTVPGLQRLGDDSPPRLAGITIEVWRERDLYIGTRIDVILAGLDAAA